MQEGVETIKEAPDYARYLQNLTRAGFFHGKMEGSEKWKMREEEAKQGLEKGKSS